jgi:hypothetical protein
MRIGLVAAAMALFGVANAHGVGLRGAPDDAQLYLCVHNPVSRVATLAAQPVRCCEGKLQCPQFLSTTTLLKSKHAPRT